MVLGVPILMHFTAVVHNKILQSEFYMFVPLDKMCFDTQICNTVEFSMLLCRLT